MNEEALQSLRDRIRTNDATALADYLQSKREQMLGLLRVIAGEHLRRMVEVEDLFQDIAASAVEALPRVPKENLEIDRWLEQLARRRVVDAHRKHFGAAKRAADRQHVFSQFGNSSGDDQPNIEQLLIASMTSPSMAVSRNWKLARVDKALLELSTEQRQILDFRFAQGLATSEIAERLGKTDVAIRVALSRTIKQLETKLQPGKES